MVLMELEGVPLSSLDHNEEGWGWIRVGQERVSPLCLELKGSADVRGRGEGGQCNITTVHCTLFL